MPSEDARWNISILWLKTIDSSKTFYVLQDYMWTLCLTHYLLLFYKANRAPQMVVKPLGEALLLR